MILILTSKLKSVFYFINLFLTLNLQVICFYDFHSLSPEVQTKFRLSNSFILHLLLYKYKLIKNFFYLDTVESGFFMNLDIKQDLLFSKKKMSLFVFLNFNPENYNHKCLINELNYLNYYVIVFTKSDNVFLFNKFLSVCTIDLTNVLIFKGFFFLLDSVLTNFISKHNLNYSYLNFEKIYFILFVVFLNINLKLILKYLYFLNSKNSDKLNLNLIFFRKKFKKFIKIKVESEYNFFKKILKLLKFSKFKLIFLLFKKCINKFNLFIHQFNRKKKLINFFSLSSLYFNFIKRYIRTQTTYDK